MVRTAIPKQYWQLALDQISLCGWGSRVSIAVADEESDLQLMTRPAPFYGVSYDPKDDALAFGTENLKHRIIHPKHIDLTHEGVTICTLAITGADDRRHSLSFNPPLALGREVEVAREMA